jgi:CSLREA domain-containing protein
MFTRSLARLVAASMLASASASAATFTVDTTADSIDASPGDGLCVDAESRCSLRAAVMESNALAGADTIELPAGVFAFDLAGDDEDAAASGDLDIDDDLALVGAGPDATAIDAAGLDRVIDLRGGAAIRIEQLTLRAGFLQQSGADGGAGLRVAQGVHVALEDVVIRDNRTAQSFAGVAIDSEGCIEGSRVRVLDNRDVKTTGSAFAIAALHVWEPDDGDHGTCLVLEDSEISGNLADYAGAIESDYVPITLRRTLVADNEARFAGALLLNLQAHTLLENVTISGNRGNPGAILNDGGSRLTLVSSTVTKNTAAGDLGTNVGGIQDVHGGFGLTFLTNTILAGNGPGFFADDCDHAVSVGGGNIIGDAEHCTFDALPSDQLGVDPELGSLADNGGFTWTHLPGAAAIDRGGVTCPAEDQRGLPRPIDGDGDGTAACDVGAVEAQRDAIFASGFDA